jgi:hypothetical protein
MTASTHRCGSKAIIATARGKRFVIWQLFASARARLAARVDHEASTEIGIYSVKTTYCEAVSVADAEVARPLRLGTRLYAI